jgi:hypothetical protein
MPDKELTNCTVVSFFPATPLGSRITRPQKVPVEIVLCDIDKLWSREVAERLWHAATPDQISTKLVERQTRQSIASP